MKHFPINSSAHFSRLVREIYIIVSIWRKINSEKSLLKVPWWQVGGLISLKNVHCVFVSFLKYWTQNLLWSFRKLWLYVSVKNDNTGDYTIIKLCVGSINIHLSSSSHFTKQKIKKRAMKCFSRSHFENSWLCFSLKMADLTYVLHSIPSLKPSKKTVKGLVVRAEGMGRKQ